jgi:SanA protein
MRSFSPRFKKRFIWFFLPCFLLTISWFFAANYTIASNAEGKLFTNVNDCPEVKVGLVLGTSKTSRSGRQNLYFNHRIEAAVALYKAQKVEYLLLSGDNGSKSYNEPNDMREALVAAGVPREKIFMDFAGFRTLDSMKRAMKVFGQKKIIVISQRFHNERAIYLGEHFGMTVYGFNAKDVKKSGGFLTNTRERFARMKVFWDLFWGVDSKYLGEPVKMG